MAPPPTYRSDIPATAEERITERFADGAKLRAEYWQDGEQVGERQFFETGEPEFEMPYRAGHKHGTEYTWHAPGQLVAAEPYADGLPDGTAWQWSPRGEVIGSYQMVRGTGLDLWWSPTDEDRFVLSEARYLQNGQRHGFEWWIEEDQRRVWSENHFLGGLEHGIERVWESDGTLRDGYPRFHVHGAEVSKDDYLRAAAADASLPPCRPEDDRPERAFPPDVAQGLGPRPAASTR